MRAGHPARQRPSGRRVPPRPSMTIELGTCNPAAASICICTPSVTWGNAPPRTAGRLPRHHKGYPLRYVDLPPGPLRSATWARHPRAAQGRAMSALRGAKLPYGLGQRGPGGNSISAVRSWAFGPPDAAGRTVVITRTMRPCESVPTQCGIRDVLCTPAIAYVVRDSARIADSLHVLHTSIAMLWSSCRQSLHAVGRCMPRPSTSEHERRERNRQLAGLLRQLLVNPGSRRGRPRTLDHLHDWLRPAGGDRYGLLRATSATFSRRGTRGHHLGAHSTSPGVLFVYDSTNLMNRLSM